MKLSELKFESKEKQRLLQRYILEMQTVEDFLCLSLLEIKRIGRLGSSDDATNFRAEVAEQYINFSVGNDPQAGEQALTITAQELCNLEANAGIRPMTSGCEVIDAALPVFVPGHVVEIAGESGCGKTQLSLQLCVAAQLPAELGGLGSKAMYVTTEGNVPTQRLCDIADAVRRAAPGALPQNPLDGITVLPMLHYCSDRYTELLQGCERKCDEEGIRLVVVDSIAAMFRGRSEMEDPIHRSEAIWSIAHVLHSIASKGAVVVVVNQVSSVIDKFPSSGGGVGGVLNRVSPALGLSWSNTVNTRVLVTQTPLTHDDGTTVRLMQLMFSPTLPLPTVSMLHEIRDNGNREKSAVLYHIDHDGVHGIK